MCDTTDNSYVSTYSLSWIRVSLVPDPLLSLYIRPYI